MNIKCLTLIFQFPAISLNFIYLSKKRQKNKNQIINKKTILAINKEYIIFRISKKKKESPV